MAGRPPKPTAIRILGGNAGHRPLPENEPEPPLLVEASPPPMLKGRARKAWADLCPVLIEMGVLTVGDRAALGMLCDVYGEWMELRAKVRKLGHTFTTTTEMGSTMYRPRPEVALAADAWRRAMAALQQFGLTPSARVKVQRAPAEEADPFAEFTRSG